MKISNDLLKVGAPDNVKVPSYNRATLETGIVHIGVGGFHRSHQALYIDKLCEEQSATDWAICGVGIMPQDEQLSAALHSQDCLYSLTERSGKEDTCRVVGSITDHILGLKEPKKVFEKIASASTKIVSLTVTEGGYYIDESTGEVDLEHSRVANDLSNPESPQTVYGFVLAGLALRAKNAAGPITILCCDNIQHNGEVVKKAMLRVANAINPEIAEWIGSNVSFPNSMVDRITPVPTETERALVRDTFGLDDSCPVVSEAFTQWVIEDKFAAGRPELEKVGAQFVSDVVPFERMKIRLLNATHSAMGYLGYLLGYRYIHEVALAEEYRGYLNNFMDVEMTPLVGEVPGVDLDWYKQSLIERFSNPDICDTVLRICSGGSAKIPGFVLPAIQDALKTDGPIRAMTCVVASWLRFCLAEDENGEPILMEDALAERITAIAKTAKADPKPYLEMRDLFGDLGDNERFVNELGLLLSSLYEDGAKATLELCSK
ncbi:UNVERIFIED_CONTAM: hypothetical protein GTU68_023813 [Idotea baltica]|nr:hypothetical protein [Idotea baltica]